MKNITIVVVILLLVSSSPTFADRVDTKAFISLDYRDIRNTTVYRSGRISFGFSIDEQFETSLLSVASQYDGNTVRISSNGLFIVVGGIVAFLSRSASISDSSDTQKNSGLITSEFIYPLLVQTLTNPTVRINILKDNLDVALSVKTDYYLLYEVSRIYCEGGIGLRGMLGKKFAIEAHLGIPFTEGYFKDRSPFLGARAFFIF
jgi:hypothetical protein